jgi:hypothetical protein
LKTRFNFDFIGIFILNFEKVDISGKEYFGTTDPRIGNVRMIFLAY